MGYNKVRNYTDKELLDKVKSLPSFCKIPESFWILGVRSEEDTYDVFDDKFYIFKGETFIGVMTGTTNTGAYGLLNYKKWTSAGVAQIKANEWYYDVWKRGLHKGKMEALRQTGGFKVIRDNNNNKKSGDVDAYKLEYGKGLNFHTNSYSENSTVIKQFIGKWSVGCQVINDVKKYHNFLKMSKPQNLFTYCLINEF